MSGKRRVAVLISGSGSNLQALIDACAAPDYPAEIVLAISNKAEAFGLQRAQKAGITTHLINHKDYPTRDAFDAEIDAVLRRHNIELVCLAGFMRIITAGFIEKWDGKMINIHPSLLPEFKGLHTHRRALEAGVKTAGCTVHFVVPEMDAGPIILQAEVSVLEDDTEETLAARVLAQEHVIYPQALRWLAEDRLQVQDRSVVVNDIKEPSSLGLPRGSVDSRVKRENDDG